MTINPDADLFAQIKSELGGQMVPMPDDQLAGLSQFAVLLFAREAAVTALKVWTMHYAAIDDADVDEDGTLQRVAFGIAEAAQLLSSCCVNVGLLTENEGSVPKPPNS